MWFRFRYKITKAATIPFILQSACYYGFIIELVENKNNFIIKTIVQIQVTLTFFKISSFSAKCLNVLIDLFRNVGSIMSIK